MSVILKKGEKYHHFRINGKAYQAGSLDYEMANGKLTIWPKNKSRQSPIVNNIDVSNVLDGDNSNIVFASADAIETWIGENFFF